MVERSVVVTLVLFSLICSAALAGDGLVALQTAAASCPDDSDDIYVDCGNGTVTDNRSGLVWLASADCFENQTWHDAMDIVAGLADEDSTLCAEEGLTDAECDCSLSDGSSPGDWRLPTATEWDAMIADAVALGCIDDDFGGPSITNDAGSSCWQEGPGNSFTGVEASVYWASSTVAQAAIQPSALQVWLLNGIVLFNPKTDASHMWPVRGGQ